MIAGELSSSSGPNTRVPSRAEGTLSEIWTLPQPLLSVSRRPSARKGNQKVLENSYVRYVCGWGRFCA